MMLLAAATPHLPGVLHALEPTLNNYGYLAVAGLVLIEDFGVPVPGETVLILGAVYAGSGRLSIVLVVLLGFLGAVVGDNIGFALGRFGGRRLVERWGRYILLTPERLDKATAFFERHGGKVIVIARFVEGLRQANGIVAGTTGMHWAQVPRLQRSRCGAVGRGVVGRRLLLGQPHHQHLQHRQPVQHLPGDRRGGGDHRADRPPPGAPAPPARVRLIAGGDQTATATSSSRTSRPLR